ncbi:5-formyltetrahydrofolate cyclo-ligase [Granulosicoccus antarcticus]|uniref:5-formyltetrahydrofolate cyclo-ligase n=1 Tax=Granulosicoccus antarcticus IMCC3135 TaxID=1192854 RepID=A0A2Z2NS81_9GAMM|nr:5-formyltetrahydrofolate cyclo-ligase [Granulosicoccus antarcticus]ASJ74173.1 5-formyltetrahydrofolate cyclo-ligase [Granulosicoccus antarcticus IMCC3135]
MSDSDKTPSGFSSSPCFAHELQAGQNGYEVVDAQTAIDVARWRKAQRQHLINLRLEVPARERQKAADCMAEKLDTILADSQNCIVSVYWPFRGEPNLRDWMARAIGKGVRIALPVVEIKSHPLVFREWTPEARMEPGIWNIPVPVDGPPLIPTHVISPLVGFDKESYRLGYGGGYFDRTLAQLQGKGVKPIVIGVGHSLARIATIFPQPYDIPMNVIVTESDIVWAVNQ